MTTGEEDYTKRVQVVGAIASTANVLVYGADPTILIADEGTESDAASYTKTGATAVADDTGTKSVGANSLKYTRNTPTSHSVAYRTLGTSFLWGDFTQIKVQTYRATGNFTDSDDFISIVFLQTTNWIGKGMRANINIGSDPADTWVTHTIPKASFANWYGGLLDHNTVQVQMIYVDKNQGVYPEHFFLDGFDIYAGADSHVQMRVDSDGHLQTDIQSMPALAAGTNNIGDVDVLSLPSIPAGTNNIGDVGVATLPSLPAGTNNIGDVNIADVEKTVSWYDATITASGTTGLISPGAAEKVQVKYIQVVSATDDVVVKIWEQDNNGHICFLANMLDGSICNANLIGTNYITSTVNKDLEINLSKTATVYVVIGYVLV